PVQVDFFASKDAFQRNAEREFERNEERYAFLRWGQGAFDDFSVVPPDTGIVHQVNIEYLARVVFVNDKTGQAYRDTLVGTDSHTTMVNGLGEAYAREQGMWHDESSEEPTYSDTLELDLGDVEPSLAGPKRPQDRVALADAQGEFREALGDLLPADAGDDRKPGVPPHAAA